MPSTSRSIFVGPPAFTSFTAAASTAVSVERTVVVVSGVFVDRDDERRPAAAASRFPAVSSGHLQYQTTCSADADGPRDATCQSTLRLRSSQIYTSMFTRSTRKGLDICPLPADVRHSCFRGGAGARGGKCRRLSVSSSTDGGRWALGYQLVLPKVYTRTKRYCSVIQHGLDHYQ